MNLMDKLFTQNQKEFEICVQHPFVQGMFDATLSMEKYKNYLVQDAIYLETFVKIHEELIALALPEEKGYFKARLEDLQIAEIEVRKELMEDLGIAKEEISVEHANETTKQYQDYFFEILKTKDIGKIMISLLPCYWIYQYIGEKREILVEENPFQTWVDTYKSDIYTQTVREHQEVCEKYTEDTAEIRAIFNEGCLLEVAFFDKANE